MRGLHKIHLCGMQKKSKRSCSGYKMALEAKEKGCRRKEAKYSAKLNSAEYREEQEKMLR
jgi:hypothetical protein